MDKLNAKIFISFLKIQDKRNLPACKATWQSKPAFLHRVTLFQSRLYHNNNFNTNDPIAAQPQRSAKYPAPHGRSNTPQVIYREPAPGTQRMTFGSTPLSSRPVTLPWHSLQSRAHGEQRTTAFIQLAAQHTASAAEKNPARTNSFPPATSTSFWFPEDSTNLSHPLSKCLGKNLFFPP